MSATMNNGAMGTAAANNNGNNGNKTLCYIKSWASPMAFLQDTGLPFLDRRETSDGRIFAVYGVDRQDDAGKASGFQVEMTCKTEWGPDMQISLVCRKGSGLERNSIVEKRKVYESLKEQGFSTVGQRYYDDAGEQMDNYFFIATKRGELKKEVGSMFTANGVASEEEMRSLL